MQDNGKSGATPHPSLDHQDWREIAEKASKEKDPYTLLKLVQQLCEKIDERRGNQQKGAGTRVTATDIKPTG